MQTPIDRLKDIERAFERVTAERDTLRTDLAAAREALREACEMLDRAAYGFNASVLRERAADLRKRGGIDG